jgi:hypothetical protein
MLCRDRRQEASSPELPRPQSTAQPCPPGQVADTLQHAAQSSVSCGGRSHGAMAHTLPAPPSPCTRPYAASMRFYSRRTSRTVPASSDFRALPPLASEESRLLCGQFSCTSLLKCSAKVLFGVMAACCILLILVHKQNMSDSHVEFDAALFYLLLQHSMLDMEHVKSFSDMGTDSTSQG